MASTFQISQLERDGQELIPEELHDADGVENAITAENVEEDYSYERVVNEPITHPRFMQREYSVREDKAVLSRARRFNCNLVTDEELSFLSLFYLIMAGIFSVIVSIISFWAGMLVHTDYKVNATLAYMSVMVVLIFIICMFQVYKWKDGVIKTIKNPRLKEEN